MERIKRLVGPNLALAFEMEHPSLYLDWYIHVPTVKHDFRSSGINNFQYNLDLGQVDFSVNYVHGNPKTAELLAQRYSVRRENIFVSSEGATGQNTRVIRHLAERDRKKKEAIVEYPTYEPLLRTVQEYFPHIKRLKRKENEAYQLDADDLRKLVSQKTGILVLTNPNLPSGAASGASELKEILAVAKEFEFHVLCDEIYAEFGRDNVPTIFSVDSEWGVATTSFTKAYGLGGLRAGVTLASKELVDSLYSDALNTVGSSSNLVEIVTQELLTAGAAALERHKRKWMRLKEETEDWLTENSLEFFPNKLGVTYWVKTPIEDTHKWINEYAIPRYSVAAVPGAFFLFGSNYKLTRSNMIRLGLGNINPDGSNLEGALRTFLESIDSYKTLD